MKIEIKSNLPYPLSVKNVDFDKIEVVLGEELAEISLDELLSACIGFDSLQSRRASRLMITDEQ